MTGNRMVEQVKQQVIAAFAVLPVPRLENLLGPATGDKAGERQIQRDLAGQEWTGLSADFLAARWASFCYLSAEGYRYYLPALLLRCLDNFSENNPLVHSTIYKLQPSYRALYYEGRDEWFDRQTSLFSPPQYAAVCSFLELAFENLPAMQFLAAQALRWGWNRHEHPAAEKIQQFYRRLHNYEWPTPEDGQAAALVRQIRAAFEATPYPGDDRLCGSELGDEPAEYALEFRGLDWRRIHPDLLAQHYASLSFFSAEAFRYFLPAYLIADVAGTDFNADPVFSLTHGLYEDKSFETIQALVDEGLIDTELAGLIQADQTRDSFDWYQIAVDRFSQFSYDEKKAIVSYLEYSATDEYSRDNIEAALDRYWYKSLAP